MKVGVIEIGQNSYNQTRRRRENCSPMVPAIDELAALV